MSLLCTPEALRIRREVATGALSDLATALTRALEPLLAADRILLPPQKARLTRQGGRCPTHGVLLDFDPYSSRRHRCPLCGVDYTGDDHHRWWIMNFQLWIAERAVHAGALWATTGHEACLQLCNRILTACADAYPTYPNRDNVLGPARPFFSTYLESIWSLQLAVALDLVEATSRDGATGDVLRERLLLPSLQLISEYDEGLSNRQVWNNAAIMAMGALLGRQDAVARAVHGPSGLVRHLREGLLEDGSWYEGENYHQFAHRGLWYGVTMAERLGVTVPDELRRRFDAAFRIPFQTALPDFTFPARRDSQYRVSLRQWRFAESCELGLARTEDPWLRSALESIYGGDGPVDDSARDCSAAEAERNVPPVRLTRASLGWKTLMFGLPRLAPARALLAPESIHLAGQGFGILRRQNGRVYVALDYGEPGGGHGHPDRLNLWLVVGDTRWLEDVGTGSYVEKALFWYRSTLAHNAPLANGASQPYGAGTLEAWDERDGVGWIVASFELQGGVRVRRSIVAMTDYLIDDLVWQANQPARLDVPVHVSFEADGLHRWEPAVLETTEGSGLEFVTELEQSSGARVDAFASRRNAHEVRLWVHNEGPHRWYRGRAPGPPGEAPRRFHFSRMEGTSGRQRTVWAWGDGVRGVRFGDGVTVDLVDHSHHEHAPMGNWWRVRRVTDGTIEEHLLSGVVESRPPQRPVEQSRPPEHLLQAGRPFAMDLGRRHYRRSEQTWEQAGAPTATLQVDASADALDLDVDVRKADPWFAPARDENPLDNEHPDINSDGLQLYVRTADGAVCSWILVPETGGGVRITPREAPVTLAVTADWRLTEHGYRIRCHLGRGGPTRGIGRHFSLNIVVNEISRDRERRRGQLVAAGSAGDWVYLRGDREEPRRMLAFEIVDA